MTVLSSLTFLSQEVAALNPLYASSFIKSFKDQLGKNQLSPQQLCARKVPEKTFTIEDCKLGVDGTAKPITECDYLIEVNEAYLAFKAGILERMQDRTARQRAVVDQLSTGDTDPYFQERSSKTRQRLRSMREKARARRAASAS